MGIKELVLTRLPKGGWANYPGSSKAQNILFTLAKRFIVPGQSLVLAFRPGLGREPTKQIYSLFQKSCFFPFALWPVQLPAAKPRKQRARSKGQRAAGKGQRASSNGAEGKAPGTRNSMKINERRWKSKKIIQNQWKSWEIDETPWKALKKYENQWKSMKIFENHWGKINENC